MLFTELQKEFSFMNAMQQEAVFHTEGPLLVLAGAGSGKTTVLVNRIAYILKSDLCLPWQILAITFTNKAASELRFRIMSILEQDGSDIWASTFHSMCARILRIYGDRIGFTNRFTVYDTDDSRRLMKDILKQLGIDEKMLSHRAVLSEISKAKDKMETPDKMKQSAGFDQRMISIAKAYEVYQNALQKNDAMDFDDLMFHTIRLFEAVPEVLEKYQYRFKYIMVDEYQDTNKIQYKFISMLAMKWNNLCVVGDDDQSIYKFRGADIENILSFEKQFTDAAVIRLEQNYRSTKNILIAANNIIVNNKDRKGKTLWTDNSHGEKVSVHTAYDEDGESDFIAQAILDGVAGGRKFSDFAILYRMNAQSNSIEHALARGGIPHRMIGGHRFYDREEIRDMLAYLQVINNPHDDLRLTRIINKPKRKIGNATVAKAMEIAYGLGESLYSVIKQADVYPDLSKASKRLLEFCELIDGLIEIRDSSEYSINDLYGLILEHTDYLGFLKQEKEDFQNRTENIHELSSNIIKYEQEYGEEADLQGFLEDVALQTDIDNYDGASDSVVMMTMHSSKGLEFPVVFIPGIEEGIFPSYRTIFEGPEEMSEERRLAYVAITRAKEKLYFIKTKARTIFGKTNRYLPSRFLEEIPETLVEYSGAGVRKKSFSHASEASDQFVIEDSKPSKSVPVNYSIGDKVLHKAFGEGIIIHTEKIGSDTLLKINFEEKGMKTLMANFAKLTVL